MILYRLDLYEFEYKFFTTKAHRTQSYTKNNTLSEKINNILMKTNLIINHEVLNLW